MLTEIPKEVKETCLQYEVIFAIIPEKATKQTSSEFQSSTCLSLKTQRTWYCLKKQTQNYVLQLYFFAKMPGIILLKVK